MVAWLVSVVSVLALVVVGSVVAGLVYVVGFMGGQWCFDGCLVVSGGGLW